LIDRLEELLEQVEEREEEETALSGPLGTVGVPSVPPAAADAEAELPASPGLPGQEGDGSLRASRWAGQRRPALMRGLAYPQAASALPGLYRQLVRAVSEQHGGKSGSVAVVREREPAAAAGLTAGELDRAMRRDSRRYDGGMTIF